MSGRVLLFAVVVLVGGVACDDDPGSSVGTHETDDLGSIRPVPPGGDGGEAGVDPGMLDGGEQGDAGAGSDGGADADAEGSSVGEDADVGADRGDGEVDGGAPCVVGQVQACESNCAGSVEVCRDGGWSGCEMPLERCGDRQDNDCDGQIDEGSEQVGATCTLGEGACAARGVLRCDGFGIVCDAPEGDPSDEVCNGIDDDCDGTPDNGLVEGAGQPCWVGRGACEVMGQWVCLEDTGVCLGEPGEPSVEVCNALDDDCDGSVDEGLGLGEGCAAGVGACLREGVRGCVEGAAVCLAEPGAAGDEVCNGSDDDCDGSLDEGVGGGMPCRVGVGACERTGATVCDADGGVSCLAEPGLPRVERCNGLDDDCDGAVDEDFGVGEGCAEGAGVCRREGVVVCAGEEAARCGVAVPEPGAEVCNGLDDDCDGMADEAFAVGEGCAVGIGACRAEGEVRCGGGAAVCSAVEGAAGVEVCDGIDDDCDGSVDEGFELGAVCTVGEGVCAREGVTGCTPGGGVGCLARPGEPAGEVCNDADDDCDGRVDEGLDLGSACAVGVGVCRAEGVLRCEAGSAQPVCSVRPSAPGVEGCDGRDEDCDGRVDEGLGLGAACTAGVGRCLASGAQVCGDDGGVVCDAVAGEARDEVCDGIDDDCDGMADEGLGLGEGCAVGVGACARAGRQVCGAAGAVVCSVEAGAPGNEVCNEVDDDCDGSVDEGLMVGSRCEVGVGACAAVGQRVCLDNGAVGCSAVEGAPQGEACNGVDDDCDEEVDEGLGLGEGCVVGVGACEARGVRVCDGMGGVRCDGRPGEPIGEKCNDADDDCDGSVDEAFALGERCGVGLGQCRAEGRTVCSGDGTGVRCGAVASAPAEGELCNALDDDCDGPADEGLGLGEGCVEGLGACAQRGEVVCDADEAAVCSAVALEGRVERCDAADDDCDGLVDEGFGVGERCVVGLGICARDGVRACDGGGGAVCMGEAGAAEEEVCDDLDNDCDGVVDEGPAGRPFGICGPRYLSCLAALKQGHRESGVYRIAPLNGAGALVWCDQETDGGGWTLVTSTTAPPSDGVGAWHAGLTSTEPEAAAAGVWPGLAHLPDQRFDVRFACRTGGSVDAGSSVYDLDMAFYGTPWYRRLIGGDEAAVCFATVEGDDPAFARRNLTSGEVRAAGQPYVGDGALVGEPQCDAPGDFVVDFDDGGLAAAEVMSGWGAVDGSGVCLAGGVRGQWLMFVREAIDGPLGPIGVMGVEALAEPLEAAGFAPVVLGFDEAALRARLDPLRLPAVFLGRYSFDWPVMSVAVRDLLEAYSRAGGSVVTEYDGAAVLSFSIDGSFVNSAGAPHGALLSWVDGRTGRGQVRAGPPAIAVQRPADPVMRGLGPSFVAGERFTTLRAVAGLEFPLVALARYPGGVPGWPLEWYDAVLRGARCEGNVLVGVFDYADAPDDPVVRRLVGNLAAGAVSPVPLGVGDMCPNVID